MSRRGHRRTLPWLLLLAASAATLLAAELVIIATVGQKWTGRPPAIAGWSFEVVVAGLLVAVARSETSHRKRTAHLVEGLDEALASITAVTEASLSTLRLDELLGQLLERLRDVLGANVSAILLIDDSGRRLVSRTAAGLERDAPLWVSVDDPLIAAALSMRRVRVSSENALVAGLARQLERTVESVAVCPISIDERVIGVCIVTSPVPATFDERALHLVQVVADRAGSGIERARLDESERRSRLELERARRHVSMLADASVALSVARDRYDAALDTLLEIVVPAFADRCSIGVLDENGVVAMVADRGELGRSRRDTQATRARRVGQLVERALVEGAPPVIADSFTRRGSTPGSVDPGDHSGYEVIVAAIQANERRVGAISFVLADGRTRYDEVDVATAENLAQRIGVTVARVHDFAERLRLEAELRHAQRMEAVGQLAGSVAHEFNNLLTLVNGYTELLRVRLEDDDRAIELVDDMTTVTERATLLTGQLLVISRRQPPEPIVITPVDAVRSIVDVLERVVGVGVTLRCELDPETFSVRIDPTGIQQIVVNLAINARDAMPSGGLLTIAVENVELDVDAAHDLEVGVGDYVRLTVLDTGSGMDEATLAQCFEPFFTTKPAFRGSGLGLPAVRNVVVEAGGVLRVKSEPGEGTTFAIYFPRAEDAVADVPETSPVPVGATAHRVLVADDDEEIRRLVERVLTHNGHDVTVAESGEHALALVGRSRDGFDLLVSDVDMTGMSGPELAQELRLGSPDLPVLFISGNPVDLGGTGVEPGSATYLAKPFSPSALLVAVRHLLDRRSDDQTSASAPAPTRRSNR